MLRWADAGKITRHKINALVVLFNETEVARFIASARVAVTLFSLQPTEDRAAKTPALGPGLETVTDCKRCRINAGRTCGEGQPC